MRLTYLLLSPTFGMHQYTADLANRMASIFEVNVVTTKRYPQDRYGPDVTMHTPVDLESTGLSVESMSFGRFRQVQRALELTCPDVVHVTGPHLWNVALVRWLHKKGITVLHTIHDLDPHHGVSYGRLLHLWNWLIIRASDHILVHGEVYRKRLIAGGRRPETVTFTPLTHLFVGFTLSRALAKGRLAYSYEYEPMVLFFGRQERYKGVDTLLQSYDRLLQRTGIRRAHLVIAGPGSAYCGLNEDQRPGVEWLNHLIGDDEGVALFRRCAVVVLPYRDATQSAVVAAAYYFQKPVIVTAVGALAEYVEQGKTGLIVDDEDVVEGLTQALTEVLESPSYGAELGRAGRAWYDEQRIQETKRLEMLYRQLAH